MAKVLIVDDNVDMLDTLEHLFMFYDFEVVKAENGLEALEVAENEHPGIIILDALMPVMNGFVACEKLKQNSKTKDIPVIFLSANYTEEEYRAKGLGLGADDYILKPFNAKDLITKVNSILAKRQLVEKLKIDNQSLLKAHRQFYESIDDLNKEISKFEDSYYIDSLTGLYNHLCFEKRFEESAQDCRNNQHPLSVMLIDVDFFQKINEFYGEQTGDYILIKVANVVLNNTPASDIVFRLERNKFCVVLPNADEKNAFYRAEQIRTAVQQTQFFHHDFFEFKKLSPKRKQSYQNVTISIGVGVVREQEETGENKESSLKRAEDALVSAKAKGRNITLRYSEINSRTSS